MKKTLLAAALLAGGLAACGGSSDTSVTSTAPESSAASAATTSAAPAPSVDESTSSAPDPAGEPFVEVVDQALEAYAALIGQPGQAADLALFSFPMCASYEAKFSVTQLVEAFDRHGAPRTARLRRSLTGPVG